MIKAAVGLVPEEWTPREIRHSFVSLLSDSRVALEAISRLVGHSGTTVTKTVYRQQIRPVLDDGATAATEHILPSNGSTGQSPMSRWSPRCQPAIRGSPAQTPVELRGFEPLTP